MKRPGAGPPAGARRAIRRYIFLSAAPAAEQRGGAQDEQRGGAGFGNGRAGAGGADIRTRRAAARGRGLEGAVFADDAQAEGGPGVVPFKREAGGGRAERDGRQFHEGRAVEVHFIARGAEVLEFGVAEVDDRHRGGNAPDIPPGLFRADGFLADDQVRPGRDGHVVEIRRYRARRLSSPPCSWRSPAPGFHSFPDMECGILDIPPFFAPQFRIVS